MTIIKGNSDKGRVEIIRDWYTLINGYQLAPSLEPNLYLSRTENQSVIFQFFLQLLSKIKMAMKLHLFQMCWLDENLTRIQIPKVKICCKSYDGKQHEVYVT